MLQMASSIITTRDLRLVQLLLGLERQSESAFAAYLPCKLVTHRDHICNSGSS